jgi:hypothetical protein
MITIDQLLESVDLDFEPRFVTKDGNGTITIFAGRPEYQVSVWASHQKLQTFGRIKLSEFENKHWTECLYEVPRKTTGNEIEQKMLAELERKLNSIVDAAIDAINELKGKIDGQ